MATEKRSEAAAEELITVEIDAGMKAMAERTLSELGMALPTAVRVFLYQVAYTHSLPFPVRLPDDRMTKEFE